MLHTKLSATYQQTPLFYNMLQMVVFSLREAEPGHNMPHVTTYREEDTCQVGAQLHFVSSSKIFEKLIQDMIS